MGNRSLIGVAFRRTRGRTASSFVTLLLLFSFVLGQAGTLVASAGTGDGPSATLGAAVGANAAAALESGDVDLDHIAAGPFTYNHTTGVGGAYDDRTISKSDGVVESLEGEDFACGDRIVYFTAITVEGTDGEGAIDLDFTYDGNTTSGSLVGFDDLVSVSINSPDSGNVSLDGDESATIVSEQKIGFGGAGDDRVEATIRVSGVDSGEQIILRHVVHLYCDFTETSITGNIHVTLDSATVVGGQRIQTGEQTVPLKQAGNILVPGLNVLKSCPATATVGDTITYTITVQNTGQDTLNDLVVTDPLLSANPLPGFPSSLAAGASATETFTHVVGANPDPLPNTVTAKATAAQSSFQLTDSADCVVDVLFPDLGIVKTADASPVSAGDEIGYTVTVTNDGPGTAFGVELTDTLPTNPGLDWEIDGTTGGWNCDINAGVLSCGGPNFDLGDGDSASVHIVSPTTAATCGQVQNKASVSADNDDDVDSELVTIIVECASLGITKIADDDTVNAGEDIGYTITVTNNGAGTARDVELHDTLPTNAGLDWEIDGGTGAAFCAIAAGELSCSFGDMAPNASYTVHISSPTTPDTCGVVRNSANATSSNDGNPSVGPVDITVLCPDVKVVKTADQGTIAAGDLAEFTVVVSNEGDGVAEDVTLVDTLPGGVNWSEDSPDCTIAGGVMTCSFGDLQPGATRTIHVSGRTDAADCGELVNVATVSASNEDDDDEGDNASEATITVECPNVSVLKTADDDTISSGDLAEFTIVVTSDGDSVARDVTLTDTLPAGVDWNEDSDDCTIAAGVLACSFGDLEPGQTRTIHVSGLTDAADCGELVNVATVASANESDDDLGDNASEATITVQCPLMSLVKDPDAALVDAGDPIGFTITVTNAGPGEAKDVQIQDTLPVADGIDWAIDGGSAAGLCQIAQGELTCDLGTMGAGATHDVHISSDTDFRACGVIDNTATVTISNGDGDGDDASVEVNCPDLGIDIEKSGPLKAHVGDTITYTFEVRLGTPETLYDVVVTDPNCNEGAPVYVSGDDGDAALEEDEVWNYTCTHLVTEDDPYPLLPNTATVVGNSDDGRKVEDSDDHVVTLITPDILIVKTVNPVSGNPGDTVTYSYEVTNTGDTTLYDISVDDDVLGHIGDIAQLDPQDSVTLTKDWILPEDEVLVVNVAIADGEDELGKHVTDEDDAVVTIVEALNPPTPPGPTAFTGSDAIRYGTIAAILLGLGLMAVAAGRRRRIV